MSDEAIIESSGNVYADLGLADPDAHRLKAELVRKLASVIADRSLTQTRASKLTGISQPDLSRMLNGRFRDFSSDRLLRALTRLDSDIEITVLQRGKPVGDTIHLHAAPT